MIAICAGYVETTKPVICLSSDRCLLSFVIGGIIYFVYLLFSDPLVLGDLYMKISQISNCWTFSMYVGHSSDLPSKQK